MIIKSPPCYDISHWKIVPDFRAIFPKPLLMITKATQGTWYLDSTFKTYFPAMLAAGYHRGCYHFNEASQDGRKQAEYFINYIKDYIDADTLLFLDVEQGGERASQLWAFLETVRGAYPNNPLMIYSTRLMLEDIPMTTAEKEYFKRIPVWVAGYPANPDLFNAPPNAYIPDPTRFGPVMLWQYTSHGQVEGISGDTDCNWIAPNLQLLLGNPPPQGEPMNQWYRITVAKLNLRSTPVIQTNPSNDIGDLFSGDVIETTTVSGSWVRVVKIIRAADGVTVVPTVEAWCNASPSYVLPIGAPAAGAELPAVLWVGTTKDNVEEWIRKA